MAYLTARGCGIANLFYRYGVPDRTRMRYC